MSVAAMEVAELAELAELSPRVLFQLADATQDKHMLLGYVGILCDIW